jgi:hypothetical protein
MAGWNRLAERQILKARAEGKLDGLAGQGAPLPDRTGNAFVGAADAVGFRLMAEAGAVPEEILIGRQIAEAKARYATQTDEEGRRAAMADIARLDQARAIAAEARRAFLKG